MGEGRVPRGGGCDWGEEVEVEVGRVWEVRPRLRLRKDIVGERSLGVHEHICRGAKRFWCEYLKFRFHRRRSFFNLPKFASHSATTQL